MTQPKKKDKDRRTGKGRRCCLRDRIYSISISGRTSCFEEQDELILFFKSSWCTIHPFLQIVLVQNSQRGKELNKFCPPNSSDDLCLLFCTYLSFFCGPSLGFQIIPLYLQYNIIFLHAIEPIIFRFMFHKTFSTVALYIYCVWM